MGIHSPARPPRHPPSDAITLTPTYTTVLAYGIAGLAALSSGLSFAQLGKYVHTSGGAFEYSEAIFGELVGWLVGWSTVLEITLSSSAVSRGMRGYLFGGGSSVGYALICTFRFLEWVGGARSPSAFCCSTFAHCARLATIATIVHHHP